MCVCVHVDFHRKSEQKMNKQQQKHAINSMAKSENFFVRIQIQFDASNCSMYYTEWTVIRVCLFVMTTEKVSKASKIRHLLVCLVCHLSYFSGPVQKRSNQILVLIVIVLKKELV